MLNFLSFYGLTKFRQAGNRPCSTQIGDSPARHIVETCLGTVLLATWKLRGSCGDSPCNSLCRVRRQSCFSQTSLGTAPVIKTGTVLPSMCLYTIFRFCKRKVLTHKLMLFQKSLPGFISL